MKIRFDAPNTGVACSAPAASRASVQGTKSSRPGRDGSGTSSTAVVASSSPRPACPELVEGRSPPSSRTSGRTIRHATTSALAGFPGSPTTGVPSHIASTVGLPGLIAIPCTSTPGEPSRATTCAVRSRTDTDEPADRTTASASSSAARNARSSSTASSGTIPHGTGTPPACATTAATVVPLTSRICAGPGTAPAATTSSPVERIAIRGRSRTATRVIPSAARPPTSAARSRRPAGIATAPARTSSPTARTFSPVAAASSTSTSPPWRLVSSTITTASAPRGIIAPVCVRTASRAPTATAGTTPVGTSSTKRR